MVLKSGFRCRSNQITSTLRCVSAFQPSAGPDPIEVAVDVELQQISGRITWAPGLLRLNPTKACGREIKPINERVDEANRVLRPDIVIQRFRQKQSLRAVLANEVRHAQFYRAHAESESVAIQFSHGLQEICSSRPIRVSAVNPPSRGSAW